MDDAARITHIYNWYILHTTITFELDILPPSEMEHRVREKLDKYDWLVSEVDGNVVGYAYYGAFRSRAAYNHCVELSIYLAHDQVGKGFGLPLYQQLIQSAEERGFRELLGVIALPNPESITLHQRLGFEEVGVLRNVGYKFGQYLDVGIWQKSLTASPGGESKP